MKPAIQTRVEVRFHELAAKEALGTATAADIAKLNRYQNLRSEHADRVDPAGARRQQQANAANDWAWRKLSKQLGVMKHILEGQPLLARPTHPACG